LGREKIFILTKKRLTNKDKMADYAISGIWTDTNNVITHYAFHIYNTNGSLRQATKKTKAEAVRLLDNEQNSGITILWNYTDQEWQTGTTINVVGTSPNRYLRTTHDRTVHDNLSHLINYGYIADNIS
jgi:hypothetical protein